MEETGNGRITLSVFISIPSASNAGSASGAVFFSYLRSAGQDFKKDDAEGTASQKSTW